MMNTGKCDKYNKCDQTQDQNDSAFVTTTGLVIHSIADGVALGASLFFSMLMAH